MGKDVVAIREGWIRRGTDILEEGKGHLGIINMIRSEGVDDDKAKRLSYDVFDEAVSRLRRRRRPHRMIGTILVLVGVFPFFAGALGQQKAMLVSGLPVILGVYMLSRQPRATRLPEITSRS